MVIGYFLYKSLTYKQMKKISKQKRDSKKMVILAKNWLFWLQNLEFKLKINGLHHFETSFVTSFVTSFFGYFFGYFSG